ncbi:MAG: GNAT family N-acetyltransferase [Anaerolineae bacterium]|nr:GNAT family N-acetyltransferase [Anaerolineae bacterium]
MLIRKARPEDWETCASLDHSIATDRAWRMQEQEQEGSITVAFQSICLPRPVKVRYPRQDKELTAGWANCDLFLINRQDRAVLGYVTARALPGNGLAWVQDLVVDPAWRRRGIGSKLLSEATAWASRKHLHRLVVEVQTSNFPGISFCRSQGLTFCGYHDWYWRSQDIALLFGQTVR